MTAADWSRVGLVLLRMSQVKAGRAGGGGGGVAN